MPYIQLPDRQYLEIPEGMDYSSAMQAAMKQFPTSFGLNTQAPPAPAPEPSTFGSELGRGFSESISNLGTAAGSLFGANKAAQSAVEAQQAYDKTHAASTDILKDIEEAYKKPGGGVGSAIMAGVGDLPSVVGGMLPVLGEYGAASRLGAMAGSAVAPGLGTAVGAIGAPLALAFAQHYGSNIQQQAAEQMQKGEPVDVHTGKALAYAAPEAVLDAVQPLTLGKSVAGALFGKGVKNLLERGAEEGAEKVANRTLGQAVAAGAAHTAATGVPLMVTQTALQRAQLGKSLVDEDAFHDYGNAMLAAILSSPVGAYDGYLGRGKARDVVERARAEAAEKAAKEQEAAQTATEATAEQAPAPFSAGPQGELPGMETPPSEFENTQAAPQPQAAPEEAPVDYHRQALLLEKQLDDLKTQASQTMDPRQILELAQQHDQAEAALKQAKELAGKQPKPPEVQLAEAEKALEKAKEQGDMKAAAKHAQKILDMQAVGGTQQTLDLGKPQKLVQEPVPIVQKAPIIEAKSATREANQQRLNTVEEEEQAAREQQAAAEAQHTKDIEDIKNRTVPNQLEMFTPEEAPLKEVPKTEEPKAEEPKAEEPKAEAPATEETDKPDLGQLDLFSPENIRNTEQQNLPAETRARMERQRTLEILDKKLDLPGKVVTRATLPDDDNKRMLRAGTHPNEYKQRLWDEGGEQAYDYQTTMDEIERIKAQINKPQGNSNMSLYDRLVGLANEHEALTRSLEEGEPTPVQRGYTQRKLDTLKRQYDAIVDKYVAPARKKIEDLHRRLYNVQDVAKASDIALAQAADRAARAQEPGISRAAKRARRMNAGDVKYEVERSADAQKLAQDLGRQEPGYKKELAKVQKRLLDLRNKHGIDSEEANAYKEAMLKELKDLAVKLGRATPEYKITVKQRVQDYAQALKESGPETVASKRTDQMTRKVNRAPRELRVGKPKDEGLPTTYREETRTDLSEDNQNRLAKGALTGVLGDLAKSSANPLIREKAQMLLEHNKDTNVKIVSDLKHDGKSVPALYDPSTNTIKFHIDGMNEEDLIHEATHAATSRLLDTPAKDLSPYKRYARNELEGLYNKLKADGVLTGEYAAKDLHEFAAELTSNQGLREKLDGMEWQGQSMLRRIMNSVMKFFGLNPRDALAAADHYVNKMRADSVAYDRQTGAMASMFRSEAKYAPGLERAAAVANKTIATQKPFTERYDRDALGRGGLEFMTKMVDQFAPLVRASKLMDSLAGTQMMYFLRMSAQRSNLLGSVLANGSLERKEFKRADGKKEFLYQTKKDANLVNVNKLLSKANDITGGGRQTDALFSLYSVAKRAESVGIAKLQYEGLTQRELNDAMQDIRSKPGLEQIFKEAHTEYQKFNSNMVNFAVQTGYLSKELAAKMLANKDYIPYYREKNGEVTMMMGGEEIGNIGNIKSQPYLHELVGGNERILDFNSAAVRNANMLLEMGLRNQAAQSAAFNLQEIGMARIGKGAGRGTDVFNFKRDGEDYHALVQDGKGVPADLLVKGMEGIPVQTSSLLHLMGLPSRLLRQMFVANPISAGRILFKDTLSSAMTSGSNLDTVGKALRTVGENLMERRGLSGGEVFQGLPDDMANILREVQSGKPGWETLLAKAHVLHAKADALTRQIRYESYIKQGLSEMEASYMALESMNFTRRGISPSIHVLNTLNPFINSQIQGINTLVQSIRGTMPMNEKLKIREKIIQRGMLVAGATMLYATMMQDKDAYKNATPDQKFNNWFLPLDTFGVKEPLRVPIPFEAGMLFKAVPEMLVSALHGNKDEAAEGLKQVVQKMIPGGDTYGIPQALRPGIETATGKSFYTGRDLESRHEQSLQPGYRARPSTSGFADSLGQELNVSPIKIDHLIQGYTGSLGLAITQMASSLVFGKQKQEQIAPNLSQMPLVGSSFQPQDAGAILEQTYKVMNDAAQVKATYKDMLDKGRTDAAQAYLNKNSEEFNKAALAPRFTSDMTRFTNATKAIQIQVATRQITPEEGRAKRNALIAQRTADASQFLKLAGGKTTPQ